MDIDSKTKMILLGGRLSAALCIPHAAKAPLYFATYGSPSSLPQSATIELMVARRWISFSILGVLFHHLRISYVLPFLVYISPFFLARPASLLSLESFPRNRRRCDILEGIAIHLRTDGPLSGFLRLIPSLPSLDYRRISFFFVAKKARRVISVCPKQGTEQNGGHFSSVLFNSPLRKKKAWLSVGSVLLRPWPRLRTRVTNSPRQKRESELIAIPVGSQEEKKVSLPCCTFVQYKCRAPYPCSFPFPRPFF